MSEETKAVLRGLGVLGASAVVLSTFVSWYSYEVLFRTGPGAQVFDAPVTLWNLTTLAPVLLVAGSCVALAMIALVTSRVAGVVTALIGLGVEAYAVVRAFEIPSVAASGIAGGLPSVAATTVLDGGVFLAMSGGVLLVVASLADLLPSEEVAPATATTSGRTGPRRRRSVPGPGRTIQR
jgi:hypothetical protein